jgi:hypothetical protein
VSLPASINPVTEDETFSTYLMFQPPGGIWVPLRLIQWQLHDEAQPNGVGGWNAINSNDGKTTKITGDDPSSAFPRWTSHYP